MAKAAPSLKDLRSTVRRTYGQVWVLEKQSGNFKVQKIKGPRSDAQGKAATRPTIYTKIAFAPSSGTALQVLIGEMIRHDAQRCRATAVP